MPPSLFFAHEFLRTFTTTARWGRQRTVYGVGDKGKAFRPLDLCQKSTDGAGTNKPLADNICFTVASLN